MTEQDLLTELRRGSEDAYDVVFRTCYARMVHFAAGMLGDTATAEEIVQDVMLELWRRRTTLTVETSLQAYLFRATRNRALNHLRHEKVVARGMAFAAQQMFSPPRGDRNLSEAEIDVALQSSIATLPARCREVFELSRLQGLKYNEIAAALGISVKTVEAQMGKALKILREKMSPFLKEG